MGVGYLIWLFLLCSVHRGVRSDSLKEVSKLKVLIWLMIWLTCQFDGFDLQRGETYKYWRQDNEKDGKKKLADVNCMNMCLIRNSFIIKRCKWLYIYIYSKEYIYIYIYIYVYIYIYIYIRSPLTLSLFLFLFLFLSLSLSLSLSFFIHSYGL